MSMKPVLTAAALAGASLFASPALADGHACTVAGDPYDLDDAAVVALYACISDKMAEQYASQGDAVGGAYRDWAVTSTRPAIAGPHGERFLQTFVNDIGAEEYLKFADEGVKMPAGSVMAKESFKVKKDGTLAVGPLFIMTKLEEGGAPDYGDWLYAALQPSGKTMGIKQSFCHDCHVGWEAQDALAYPLEEVRISN